MSTPTRTPQRKPPRYAELAWERDKAILAAAREGMAREAVNRPAKRPHKALGGPVAASEPVCVRDYVSTAERSDYQKEG